LRVVFPKIEKDIKVYIVGIGYETPHEEIFRACDKWVGHVDGMVWGDGRFDFFPAKNDYSENGWLDAAEQRPPGSASVGFYRRFHTQSHHHRDGRGRSRHRRRT